MSALLFGSISTLSDTSELQRAAFNVAFTEHGLEWLWEREDYQQMLTTNGGEQRIADYAAQRGEQVDAAAIHASKSRQFRETLDAVPIRERPGVKDTITAALDAGWKLGLVTTTSPGNVDGILKGLGLTRDQFDVVVDGSLVQAGKPDPASYEYALRELGEDAGHCVAIEDNVGGLAAARAAGVPCVVFANENTAGHDFGDAPRTAHLDFAELTELTGVAA